MDLTASQKLILRTNLARDRAEAMLENLLVARSEAARRVAKRAVGSERMFSAITLAIQSTRRAIGQLNCALTMEERGLDREACKALDLTLAELNNAPRLVA